MSAATTVPLSEYLHTSYRPDCDYLEGELLERNVGEWEHARLQSLLTRYFGNRESEFGILVVPEQRVQVKARRFRVPDVTVISGSRPATGIITEPPFLCIEILSPDDSFRQMQERIDDYLTFGVRYVWVIDPQTKHANIYTRNTIQKVEDGILTTTNPDITVNLHELK